MYNVRAWAITYCPRPHWTIPRNVDIKVSACCLAVSPVYTHYTGLGCCLIIAVYEWCGILRPLKKLWHRTAAEFFMSEVWVVCTCWLVFIGILGTCLKEGQVLATGTVRLLGSLHCFHLLYVELPHGFVSDFICAHVILSLQFPASEIAATCSLMG